MSTLATAWAMRVEGLSPTAKFVLIVLADAHNGHSGECYPSIARIAETTGFGESTVKYAVRNLEEEGLISREIQTDPNGRTRGVQYTLAIPSARGHLPPPRGQMTTGEGSSDEGGRGHLTPSHIEEPEKVTGKETKQERATRLPNDWAAPDTFIEFAITEGLTHDEVKRYVEPVFRDYWVPLGTERRGRKSDWLATWRNWVRRDAARIIRSRQANPSRNGRAGSGVLGAYQRAAAFVQAQNHVPTERPDVLDL